MTTPTKHDALRRGATLALRYAIFAALTLAVLTWVSMVVKPVRIGGAAWGDYAVLGPDSVDVVFFGNSHVFAGVDPATIWETRGIPSFVHAGPMQRLDVTAYYVDQALKTQSPRVVAVELSSAAYEDDDYNQRFQIINVGYMPWSPDKLGAALNATPEEDRVAALSDLWTYHTRWAELEPGDWHVVGKHRELHFLRGFQPKLNTHPVEDMASGEATTAAATQRMLDHNIEALRSIASTCQRNDVELLLFLNPTGPPNRYSRLLEGAYSTLSAEFDNMQMLDLSEPGAVEGLSYETDFFDEGHLNWQGAEHSSAALAGYLAELYDLPDRSADPAYSTSASDAELKASYVAEQLAEL